MLFAERHRKLGRDGSRAHDRAEDLLTSTAFQLLRYLPLADGLLAVLGRVRAVGADGQIQPTAPTWCDLTDITAVKYDFWPHWGQHGQPDVVLTLHAADAVLGRLVVEVKLDSGKSGSAEDEAAADEVETPDPDQLRKYWQGLRATPGGPALGVVYLTSHPVPPTDELAESVAREPGDWLGWLSWRDVWSAVRVCAALPAQDLTEILAAKGLKGFDGFHAKPVAVPASGRFWVPMKREWFDLKPMPLPATGRFWSSTGDEV